MTEVNAEHLSDDEIDALLERFDAADPALQRLIVVQFALAAERYRLALLRLIHIDKVKTFEAVAWLRRIVADALLIDVADLDRILKETAP